MIVPVGFSFTSCSLPKVIGIKDLIVVVALNAVDVHLGTIFMQDMSVYIE